MDDSTQTAVFGVLALKANVKFSPSVLVCTSTLVGHVAPKPCVSVHRARAACLQGHPTDGGGGCEDNIEHHGL